VPTVNRSSQEVLVLPVSRPWHRSATAVLIGLALLLAACGGTTTTSTSTPTGSPTPSTTAGSATTVTIAPETNAPGDIPDTTAYVPYSNVAGRYTFSHPEGWAQTTQGTSVSFTDKYNGAAATVDRLVNAFPADKQPHVRTMLSTSLRGVVSQQLIPKTDKQGRVAALEILINTPAVANLIRQGKMDQLENAMQSGTATGMKLMDTAIQALLDSRQISGQEAFKKSINKSKFEQFREAS